MYSFLTTYLLIGFVLAWIPANVWGWQRQTSSWQWELFGTILWPLALLVGLFSK